VNVILAEKERGQKVLVMILEPGNIHRITHGEPVTLRVEDWFPDGIPRKLELVIMHSETPIADAHVLAKEAPFTLDERTPQYRSRPACPQCKSTVEQAGVGRNDSPVAFVFCVMCGAVLGVLPRREVEKLKEESNAQTAQR